MVTKLGSSCLWRTLYWLSYSHSSRITYLIKKKINLSSWERFQQLGAAVPSPSQPPTPQIQRSIQHIGLFMDHFPHSVGRHTFCVHPSCFLFKVCFSAWSSPTWQSFKDIPISGNTFPGQPPFSGISTCVFVSISEILGKYSWVSFLVSPQSAGTTLPIFVLSIPIAQCWLCWWWADNNLSKCQYLHIVKQNFLS